MPKRSITALAAAATLITAYFFHSFIIFAAGTIILCSLWLPASIIAFAGIATTVGLLSIKYASISASAPTAYITGRNNTALFIISDGHGLSNVHMATAQSLLERHPDIQLHFATYPKMESKVARLSQQAKTRQPRAKDILFHAITSGRPFFEAMDDIVPRFAAGGQISSVAPPGLRGVGQLVSLMGKAFAPWRPEEHLALHNEIRGVIDDVDPAVVLLDTVFAPAIEATRGRNRMHAFITPNTLVDNFPHVQPRGKMFWKYPALSSGFPYPVPWTLIPANVYLNARVIYTLLTMSGVEPIRKYLREHDVKDPVNFMGLHRPEIPWITQSTPGAMIPVDVIPANVTCTGPMVLSPASAEETDPRLAEWLKLAPTVLINLGSTFTYGIAQTERMIATIERLLETSNLQVLWKYNISPPVALEYDWQRAVKGLTDTGRVQVLSWISVDPPALLQSGHITAFVSHGGAGGYHEAIEAGVPTVVLPMWVDLYNFAQLTEQIGVGLWACQDTSPYYDEECLGAAIMRVSDGGPESVAMRAKVKELSRKARLNPGRDVAADVVAKLAALQKLENNGGGLCQRA